MSAYGILYEIDKVGILANTKRIFEDTSDNVNTAWTSLTDTSDDAYGTISGEPVLTATKVSASSSASLKSGQVTAVAHWAKNGVTLTSPVVSVASVISGSTVGSDGTITVSPSTEGAAASGANADITSMSALTGAIATPTTITASSTITTTQGTVVSGSNSHAGGVTISDGGATQHKATVVAATHVGDITYTIPDAGTAASFVVTAAAQTIGGVKTFSSGVPITATTNQLILGGASHLLTISSPAISAASQTYTIPDAGGAATFCTTATAYGQIVAAPANAASTGTTGQIAYDTGFIYVCVGTNTWKQVAVATWP